LYASGEINDVWSLICTVQYVYHSLVEQWEYTIKNSFPAENNVLGMICQFMAHKKPGMDGPFLAHYYVTKTCPFLEDFWRFNVWANPLLCIKRAVHCAIGVANQLLCCRHARNGPI
jgi:hypothetical protein